MNKLQKDYIKAKSILEILENERNNAEEEFCKNLGVINDDGTIPERTWMIDNDEIAEKAIEDFEKIIEDSGLWAQINAAKDSLKEAEEKLIQYSLSIIPFQKERAILERTSKTNLNIRNKMIDLVMRLDTKTVKA